MRKEVPFMPNGGKGAVAKVYIEAEVIDNFKQQAAKIKTGLGNGLKDLKDLDLNFGFDTEAMAKAAGKELNTIMDLATNKKLNKLDFSGIMPGMISFLNNNEIADELKLQIVQGLRQGLEEFNQTATSIDINNLVRRGDGADVWSNLLFSNATKDIVNSLGLKKGDNNIFLKQFGSLTSSSISGDKGSFIQDLSQLLSLKATAEKEKYQDVLKYLVSGKYVDGRGNEQQMFEMSTINDAIRINDFYEKSAQGKLTNKDIKDFAGYVGRLQYLTTVSDDKGLREIYDSIIENKHYDELFNNQDSRDEGLSKEQLDLFHSVMDKVIEASKYKDDQYRAIDKQAFNTDILQAINALFSAAGDNGTIARLAPLIQGWERDKPQLSADQLLADTIKSLGLKSEDSGLRQQEGSDEAKRAEAAAERAENAADRAENASEEARAIAEDIKGAVEEGTAEASGASKTDKKSKKKPSPQTSAESAEQIADDAEADAESAEHVADALEDKKARLETTIAELENKKKELEGLNDKYQKAISNTFGDVKTPEEALALFKEKAAQLQQADKDFAEIVPQRNFTEPKDAKEIAILEEYEKRLAALQQALVEYKKASETAMDKGVNPVDIRANQVDEERLQLNFADNTIDGYIKGLQKAIEDNKKKISEYENLLKTYRGQLEEFTRQGSPSDAKPSGGEQTQSRSAVDTAREETASGVQEEGNEASDAASKMQALAQAKKEALEANKQLAESANTTTNAIQNESDAGNFDELIAKLVETAKLLAQLPQSFEGFKGFDLEPLKTLSETIQQLPKEGLNISLGDDFNNLANSIDEVLNKVQELTSEAKIAEIEGNITQKYDEQIKQLKADAEEAKRVIEELKRTKQKTTEVERNPATDVDALIKEYGNLKRAQEELFTINSADEYSAALEKREEILQRILELEQKVALSDVGQAQIDNLLMGYGDDASSNFSALSEARNAAQKSSVGQLAKEYVDQQKAEIKALADSLSSIDIIPKEAQSNWSKSRKEEYNQIAEGAQVASQAIETLNANLAVMEANGASPEVLKTFLQLKESTAQMVKDTQDKSNVFGESIEAASTRLLDRLSNIETRLQVIKRDSGKLINVDPALAGALETIEKHLNKIQDLKNTVSNDPLQAINPEFTRPTTHYLFEMMGKGKKQNVLEGLEQVSDRSQTDFSRLTVNYGKYASALKKLFDDMAQGAKVSMGQLETDMERVSYLAEKLSNTTGLGKGELLTGELSAKADPRVADAQRDALDKANVGLEKLQTKIDSTITNAQDKITKIFGEGGISDLSESFAGGSVEGFDKFVQSATDADKAMQTLKQAFDDIGKNPSLATQIDKVREINEAMGDLNKSLKDVSDNASKFEIVDKNEIGKLKASTAQFLRSNPNLNIDEISGIKDYLDQLQEGINRTDFSAIQKGIDGIKQSAVEAGHTGGTFVSLLTERFKALGAYLLSFASFYRVISVFKDGINIIHELDDALTEMNKVSTESLASLRDYQKESFGVANDVGTTAIQLQQSTADFIRLGESFSEAKESARVANELLTVSEFDNIQDATTALTAISAAYEDTVNGLDKQAIIDKLNKIGDEYAISTDGLATALQDSASALTTANNDMDEAAALIAAGNTVTQDPSKTGKAMRTVALRLVGMKCA